MRNGSLGPVKWLVSNCCQCQWHLAPIWSSLIPRRYSNCNFQPNLSWTRPSQPSRPSNQYPNYNTRTTRSIHVSLFNGFHHLYSAPFTAPTATPTLYSNAAARAPPCRCRALSQCRGTLELNQVSGYHSLAQKLPTTALSTYDSVDPSDDKEYIVPPPQTPTSEPSSFSAPSQRPPPFSSLYFPTAAELDSIRATVAETSCESLLATVPAPSFEEALAEDDAQSKAEAETKAALPQDTKAQSSKATDEGEPPPPYTEGSSPIDSFTYVMAAAGGAASIITQVQQTAGPPINTLGGMLRTSKMDRNMLC